MTRRAAAILLLVLGAAVVATVLLTRPRVAATGKRRGLSFLRVTPAPMAVSPAAAGTPAVTAVQTVRVTIFFPGKDDEKLHAEERDIAKPAGASAYLKALFAELKRGPTREALVAALPGKIALRGAYLPADGVAVLDLAMDPPPSLGSSEEVTIVAALVDTVLQNVAGTTRVRLLVNGEPAETLGGHVDLTRPLLYFRNEVAP
jgi:spore germination protein GerM